MNAEDLATALGGHRSGRQFVCCCPAHADVEPSLIVFDGRESVQVRCMAGCEQDKIIAELKRQKLWNVEPPAWSKKSTRERRQAVDDRIDRHRELAQTIFDDADPILGTLAEQYFVSRDLLDVAIRFQDIRFHPSCPRDRERQPAVVVAMRSMATRAVMAVQRIFLERRFGAVAKDGAMMLGGVGGAAMMLGAAGDVLNIAEGLETGLSVLAMDHAPVWCLGSSSLVRTMPVLDGVRHLVLWVDHDRLDERTGKRAGLDAAMVCRERWLLAGRAVSGWYPEAEGEDANDVWRARCARQ